MPPTQPPKYEQPKYDTPTNIIAKQGGMYRGMANAKGKPLWLRIMIVIFSVILFLIPGILLMCTVAIAIIDQIIEAKIGTGIGKTVPELVSMIPSIIIGLIFIYCGIMISYRNIRGIN